MSPTTTASSTARSPPVSPATCATSSRTCAGSCSRRAGTMAIEVKVPDIGDFKDVPIIEVHVQAGARVKAEDPLITLESDKATMDVPAPQAGTVAEVTVAVGDRVAEGALILLLEPEGEAATYGSSAGAYETIEVKVPDIGDFKDVPVIEVHVGEGDAVKAEDPLITLESDKATMDVPAPQAGTVAEVKVAVGDRVAEGALILLLEPEGAAAIPPKEKVKEGGAPASGEPATYGSSAGAYETIEVKVPDIGDFKDVPVIEVHVAEGTTVKAEDPLLTLESDKATMDVPSPAAGTVKELQVKVGDRVSEGRVILVLEMEEAVAGRPAAPP